MLSEQIALVTGAGDTYKRFLEIGFGKTQGIKHGLSGRLGRILRYGFAVLV